LLSEADLNNEQSYWLAKSRLHNRYLNGWGVVCGMQVVCGECDGWVTVRSGYAIDPCGNDVIVCADQNFNVLQAIQNCCAPAKQQTSNCSPLRYNPSPNCQGTTQVWCITIQYQEQPSRMITPLTASTSQSTCSCGCSNGNGKSSSTPTTTTTSSCKTTTTQTTTVPAGSCEATRIVEGFQLGVVSAEEVEAAAAAAAPGSLKYVLDQCLSGLLLLIEQAPQFTDNTLPQSAYQSTCSFFALVKKYFAKNSTLTHCSVFDQLAAIAIPSGSDTATYTGIVASIVKLLADAFLDCICFSILPSCPPPPCDNRIILACVTVQDNAIIDICHFSGRKQLITLQTLGYWLGPFGLDNIRTILGELLRAGCCGEEKREVGNTTFYPARESYNNEMLTTAGITTAAAVNRITTHYLTQAMGASVVNAMSPGARSVDLRTLVNMPTETVQAQLKQQGFQVTPQQVDDDPSWTADAVNSSAQFAPAAVSAGQPLTMYTKGGVAVGFDVIDPTTAKIQDLQSQITALQNQIGQTQTPAPTQNPTGAQTQPKQATPKSTKPPS
jgi:hypothetical protein